jgi:hypothetical protein
LGKYVKEWETIKKKFETDAGIKRPKESIKKAIIGTVQKSSGLTPVLQEIDNAIDKKERLTLEKAMNKYHTVQEPYVAFVRKEMKTYDATVDEDIVLAYATFMREMLMLEDKMSVDAKALQEKKGGGVSIKWLFLEADVKGTIDKAKKDFAAYATFEKKFKLIDNAGPALKAAQDYTKAAARTEVANALKSIKEFQVKAKVAANACDAALKDAEAKKKSDYIDSVTSFKSAMNSLSTASRTTDQVKALEALG